MAKSIQVLRILLHTDEEIKETRFSAVLDLPAENSQEQNCVVSKLLSIGHPATAAQANQDSSSPEPMCSLTCSGPIPDKSPNFWKNFQQETIMT